MSANNDKDKPFYVGYRSMPKALSSFYRLVIAALLMLVVIVAIVFSTAQKKVGKGSWNAFESVEKIGTLYLDPYPILYTDKGPVLLVQIGKRSANSIAESYHGQSVKITGFPIVRGDWRMLEIEGTSSIIVQEQAPKDLPELVSLGPVNIAGEIVDSKCFLGVMKPGEGHVHRACATLCLKGGIPPILVARDQQGELRGYLVVNQEGSSASVDVASLAALPVSVSGELEQRGDLLYVRMDAKGAQALSGQARENYGPSLVEYLAAQAVPKSCRH